MADKSKTAWLRVIHELHDLDDERKWIFRGDLAVSHDDVRPGLEIACNAWRAGRPDPLETERCLLADFQRRYPAWENWAPPDDDALAWMALMQHYGAPTRLLDCTYSPFIACYFALQKLLMSKDKEEASVFFFRKSWFEEQVDELLRDSGRLGALNRVRHNHDGRAFEQLFLRGQPVQFVYPVNPRAMNERLTQQQGVFLCPGDIRVSFADNLKSLKYRRLRENCRRVRLPRSVLRIGLSELLRMNLDAATLFPGLQGYAESLRTRLPFLARLES